MATQLSSFSYAMDAAPQPKKRCCADNCKKRITLIDFDCKCGNRYCSSHRHPETHDCKFDHKAHEQAKLTKQLVKVDGLDSKLERI